MSALSVRLPNSLHKVLHEIADKEKSSMNQVIVLAVAEKISALLTADYLTQRAQKGSRNKFLRALGKVSQK